MHFSVWKALCLGWGDGHECRMQEPSEGRRHLDSRDNVSSSSGTACNIPKQTLHYLSRRIIFTQFHTLGRMTFPTSSESLTRLLPTKHKAICPPAPAASLGAPQPQRAQPPQTQQPCLAEQTAHTATMTESSLHTGNTACVPSTLHCM